MTGNEEDFKVMLKKKPITGNAPLLKWIRVLLHVWEWLVFLCCNSFLVSNRPLITNLSSFACKRYHQGNVLKYYFLTQNHRIIGWSGLEGTLKIVSFQPTCYGQGHLPPDQVAQSPIQPGLEHRQGGGSHSFSGQPAAPVPHCPHSEEFLSTYLRKVQIHE